MITLAGELRAHLAAAGVVRYPDEPGELPACYVEERDGAVAPTADAPVTVHLSTSGGLGLTVADAMAGFDWPTISVYVWTLDPVEAERLRRALTAELSGRCGFELGRLHVERCAVWQRFQRDWQQPSVGWGFTCQFAFLVREASYDAA